MGIFALQEQTVRHGITEKDSGDGQGSEKPLEQRQVGLPARSQKEKDKPGKEMNVKWEDGQEDYWYRRIFGVCPVMVSESSESTNLSFPEQSNLYLTLLQ